MPTETVESARGMNSQLNYSILSDLRKKKRFRDRGSFDFGRGGGFGAIERINLESPE